MHVVYLVAETLSAEVLSAPLPAPAPTRLLLLLLLITLSRFTRYAKYNTVAIITPENAKCSTCITTTSSNNSTVFNYTVSVSPFRMYISLLYCDREGITSLRNGIVRNVTRTFLRCVLQKMFSNDDGNNSTNTNSTESSLLSFAVVGLLVNNGDGKSHRGAQ